MQVNTVLQRDSRSPSWHGTVTRIWVRKMLNVRRLTFSVWSCAAETKVLASQMARACLRTCGKCSPPCQVAGTRILTTSWSALVPHLIPRNCSVTSNLSSVVKPNVNTQRFLVVNYLMPSWLVSAVQMHHMFLYPFVNDKSVAMYGAEVSVWGLIRKTRRNLAKGQSRYILHGMTAMSQDARGTNHGSLLYLSWSGLIQGGSWALLFQRNRRAITTLLQMKSSQRFQTSVTFGRIIPALSSAMPLFQQRGS